ncbi:MAG: histidine kinase [Paenibacillus sp.]|jgi:two-component system sensor histidine kinase YesM|nr:histidine kinase [Paenibacillus sp.]
MFKRLAGWMKLRNLSMRKKLFILFCLVSMVPLAVSAFLFYRNSTQALEKELGTYTVELSHQVESRLDAFVERMEQMKDVIRFNPNVQRFLTFSRYNDDPAQIDTINEVNRLFQQTVTLRGELQGIFLYNEHGLRAYYTSDGVAKFDYDLNQDPFFRNSDWSRFGFLLPTHPQRYVKNKEVLSYAGKVTDFTDFKESGTLIIDISPEEIGRMSQTIKLGSSGYMFVTDPQGTPVRQEEGRAVHWTRDASFQQLLRNQSGYTTLTINGEKMLVGFSTSALTGWKIIGAVPFREVASGISNIRFQLLIMGICSLLLVFVLSTLLSRAFTRPLKELETKMTLVEKGDFSARLLLDRGDEIGRLSRKFNHMLVELNRLEEEVYVAQIREYKLESMRKESQLAALQAQINPHFLYNTLNTMTCMAEVYDAPDLADMSRSLAHVFKYSVHGSPSTRLEEELDHVSAYMQIISTRYPDAVRCHIEVAEELKDALVPKLIVQPIIENAFLHGLNEKEEVGNVWIRAFTDSGGLVLEVADDGIGMSEARLAEIHRMLEDGTARGKPYGHIGLLNVHNRLSLSYGPSAGLRIDSREDEGTVVRMYIPLQTGKESLYVQSSARG